MGLSREWVAAFMLIALGGVACISEGKGESPTATGSGSAAHSSVFEVREVLDSSSSDGALNAMPFTTGVLKADDPYRDDSAFEEAPPDASGDLVTYSDADGDGFYTPGSDPKFLLGPAEITDDVRRATAVGRTAPGGTGRPRTSPPG
jgi:hypothetical protein